MGRLERLRDDDIELLLEGTSEDDDLEDLRRVLAVLRKLRRAPLDESVLTRHVEAAITESLRPDKRRRRSSTVPVRRHARAMRRPAVGLVAVVTLLLAMSGVAWAANSAKPGDSLYGIDRAFEAIGIGNGGTQERLSEIQALFVAGDLTRMLDHVSDVIPPDAVGTETATSALRAAALVVGPGSTTSGETLSAVSELLDYLSANLGSVDADEITKFAGHIRTRGFEPPDAGLTPADPTDPSGFREDG